MGAPHPPVPRVVALGVCERCGLVHEHCKAHRSPKQTEGDPNVPCRVNATEGRLVCWRHGGKTPRALEGGQRRLAQERALGEVGELLAEAEQAVAGLTAVEHLEAGIRTAAAMATGYRWLLDQMDERADWDWEETDGPNGGVQRTVKVTSQGLLGPNARGEVRLHPYEEGLRHWTRLHGELVKNAMVLGLEERKLTLSTELVDRFGGAIIGLVAGLGHNLDDPKVIPVVEAALRVIAGDGGAPALEATAELAP